MMSGNKKRWSWLERGDGSELDKAIQESSDFEVLEAYLVALGVQVDAILDILKKLEAQSNED